MEKIMCDVLIIGGGPAGSVCAMTAKTNFPDKEVVVVREQEHQLVPCAIPYIFSETLGSTDKNLVSCAPAQKFGITTIIDTISSIDTENKTAYSKDREIHFDKLVLATGSTPFVHPALENSLEFEGVFAVPKNVSYIDKMQHYTDTKKKIIVVGTGFIGIEMAMEFAEDGKDVTVVGGSKHILKNSFDTEIAIKAEEIMLNAGIDYVGGDRVTQIIDNNGIVSGVELQSGKVLEAEVVVLATGYKANTKLAENANLKFGHYGGFWVDEYMRTEDHDVFAIGDCAMRREFITKEQSKVMLASTSSAEGRVAGSSLYGIKYLKHFSGTIAIFSTMIGDVAFSSAGVTLEQAKTGNADVVVGVFEGSNRHPATMPGAQKQYIKLIAMRNGGQIVGGQIVGGEETGEMINLVGMMIESEMTVYQVMTMQVATHPKLTAAPPMYPIVVAATMMSQEISKEL
ncbi:MAG: FAD-dependent oxidoreductase [Campylobacterota bacterium]|nr:FAD-dependent oxidoreductase [Campylobacterota bacterium]